MVRTFRVLVPVTHAVLGGSELALLRLIDACAEPGRDHTRLAASDPLALAEDRASVQAGAMEFSAWLFSPGPLESEFARRGIRFERLPLHWLRAPWGPAALAARLRATRPDAIYLHAGRAVAIAASQAKVPCIERVNMPRADGAGGWCRFRALDRALTNRNDRVLAVSESLRDELVERGVLAHKVLVMRDPVDAERFHGARRPRGRERGRGRGPGREPEREPGPRSEESAPFVGSPLGEQAPDERLVLSIGRLTKQKGYDDLLRIAGACKETLGRGDAPHNRAYRRVRFLIVGDGPLEQELSEQIRRRDLSELVGMLAFQDEVAPLYHAADVYLQTSRWEGLAAVLMEARASGLPIVATDVNGTREALRDYRAAHLYRPGDHHAAARAILDFLDDPVPPSPSVPEEFVPSRVAQLFARVVSEVVRS